MAERRTAASRRTTPRGGRTTPKGTRPGNQPRPASSARYTPPAPDVHQPSPLWVPVLMFGLIGLGIVTILLNYLNLLPGDADNRYLVLGMVLITGGFITATRYR
jgi:hypothetical protein